MNFGIQPFKITRPKPGLLKAEWQDGFSSTIKIEKLRLECPCADCRDKEKEDMKGKAMLPNFTPGKYELKSLTPVGNYAVNAVWGDGHSSGIYPWEFFRVIFENYKLSNKELNSLDKKQEPVIPILNVRK